MSRVYLSGPMTGVAYDEAETWRDQIQDVSRRKLHRLDRDPGLVDFFSPLRGEASLAETPIIGDEADYVFRRKEDMVIRDYWDTVNADIVIVNLLGATRVSIGTMIEVAWAWDHRIPMIFIMEDRGCLHDHPMVRAMRTFRVESFDAAVDALFVLLNLKV